MEESRYEIRSADRGRRAARVAAPVTHRPERVQHDLVSGRGCRVQGLVLSSPDRGWKRARRCLDPDSDPPAAEQASVTAVAIPAARIAEGIEAMPRTAERYRAPAGQ